MAPRSLQEEIRQTKPFRSAAAEALLSVMATADRLAHRQEERMKPYGVTPTQYNVLRILRGSHPGGLPCGEVGGRMISRVPDVTRLLDRMEHLGLVERQRDTADRRVVVVRLSPRGMALVNRMDAPMDAMDDELLASLGEEKLRRLARLLGEVREALE